MESVFKYAIFHYNRLPSSWHTFTHRIRIQEESLSLIASEHAVETVQDGKKMTTDQFFAAALFTLVCSLIYQRRIQGIFGPPYPELATLIHSICYHLDIPFINVCSSCYDVENFEDEFHSETDPLSRRHRMSINLYPSTHELNIAFHNLTHRLHWTRFLIIYDTDSCRLTCDSSGRFDLGHFSALTRVQKLLNDPGINQTDILVRQFTHYKERSVLIDAIGRDIFNIILDLNDANTQIILKMALQMGMINSNYHYLLTTLVRWKTDGSS